MVWVSNRDSNTINVTITNKSGGSAETYTLVPQSKWYEGAGRNLWKRSGQETLSILRDGGKEQSLTVGPNDFVRVYSDAVIVSQANVFVA